MDCDKIIERCEDLYHDFDLGYVREWKRAHNSKAMGFMPVYIPRELIHASRMLAVGIMGAGEKEIIRGDAFFQSYICRIPRSTIELAVTGKLDILDGLLFPAICDVIRNLSGMWQILFPGVYVKYLDLPQNFGETGGLYYYKLLQQLREDFAKLSGNTIAHEDLWESIKLYNENRKAISDLYELRAERPHLIPAWEVYLLMRASNILEVTEHTKMIEDYMASIPARKLPELDNVRIVVSGAFCEQPPLGLVRAIEGSGCYIVDDDWVLGNRCIRDEIPVTTGLDPIRALADAYLFNSVSTAFRYETSGTKGSFLVDQVRKRRADGVIFAAPSFCDPALLERPMLQDVLSERNIAYTGFKYAENTGQIQVIKEEAGTFADSIKLWGAQ